MLYRIIDRLFFRRFDGEKDIAARGVVSRYARGNVSIQAGRYLTADDVAALHIQGDRAFARLAKRVQAGRG